MATVVMVRHGLTVANKLGLFQGQSDYDLCEEGRNEIGKLAVHLKDLPATNLFTSPMARARQSAEIVEGSLGIKFSSDNRLRERNLGELDGKNQDAVERRHPGIRSDLISGNFVPAGGETITECIDRFCDFLAQVVGSETSLSLLITHGGLIAAFSRHCAGVTLDHCFVRTANCQVFEIGRGASGAEIQTLGTQVPGATLMDVLRK